MTKKIILLFILLSSIVSSQTNKMATIDSLLNKLSDSNAPGFSIGIIEDSKFVYTKGFGLANLEYDIPNSSNSVFRIASTSKQFTAACIILLIQKDKLKLNNTIYEYFPEFPE